MLNVVENGLTSEIYMNVRASVGMMEYRPQDVEKALERTLFSVVVMKGERPVGIGRVIGDGKIAFFIKDVAVVPEMQGVGVGAIIMDSLMNYIRKEGTSNAYVGLMALKDKEAFYQKYGFHVRPYRNEGSGMTQYINQI